MSHSQFHSIKCLYLDMHGLIFETSIWLLAGSTRFLSLSLQSFQKYSNRTSLATFQIKLPQKLCSTFFRIKGLIKTKCLLWIFKKDNILGTTLLGCHDHRHQIMILCSRNRKVVKNVTNNQFYPYNSTSVFFLLQ